MTETTMNKIRGKERTYMQGKEQHVGFLWPTYSSMHELVAWSTLVLSSTRCTSWPDYHLGSLLGLETAKRTGEMEDAADAQLRDRRPTHRCTALDYLWTYLWYIVRHVTFVIYMWCWWYICVVDDIYVMLVMFVIYIFCLFGWDVKNK